MARARMIKPSFFKHRELFDAESASRLPLRMAFAGLWTAADRAGRFKWKADLKPDVLPYDDVDMITVLETLEQHGFIHRYVVAGKAYGYIPSFADHQTFHKTERASTLPPPPVNGESTVKAPLANGGPVVSERSQTDTDTDTDPDTVVVDDSAREAVDGVVVGEPALTAMYVAIWCNGAIDERWPAEQRNPFVPSQAQAVAAALVQANVEPAIARQSIYDQCRASKQGEAPSHPNYFRRGVLADWEQECARRQQAASGERPPPASQRARTRGPPSRPAPQQFTYDPPASPAEPQWPKS